MKRTLAIDIGGTFIKYGIIDENYQIKRHWKVETKPFNSADEFYDYLCNNIQESVNTDYIGVCSPGLIDKNYCIKSYAAPNLNALHGSNIQIEVEKRTGKKVAAINDGKAAGLCELKLGSARGTELSAFFIIGTGIGGCICDKNGVIGGADNFAGEFHFLSYKNDKTNQPVKCGRITGMMGLTNMYNESASLENKVAYGKEVIDRYFSGDELAKQILDDWIYRVALHCLSVIVAINPEVLCIGGGISEEGWFLKALTEKYLEISNELFMGNHFLSTRIERCSFRNDSNLLGAALNVNMVYL